MVDSRIHHSGVNETPGSLTSEAQMPLIIKNKHDAISLQNIQDMRAAGASVIKTPHVGNQHRSNLVCAALGIPMHMVSFTCGTRDTNFHPHTRIVGGHAQELYPADIWTPFARLKNGMSSTRFHQQSVARVFPQTHITTDMALIQQEAALAAAVLRHATATKEELWYRRINSDGTLERIFGVTTLPETALESDVFAFTNQSSGWVIPNTAHMLFLSVWQTLSSGRDTIYHLSGPQMVGYIGKKAKHLSRAYDSLRREHPKLLPETLTLYIVPVAHCRFAVTQSQVDKLAAVDTLINWYEELQPTERKHTKERFMEVAQFFPELTTSIEHGTDLSQYDLTSSGDLVTLQWMSTAPLSRVEAIYRRLYNASEYARQNARAA